ncbi:MAG: S1C family serine protease [Actinomycetota bacterium]|nr:S1C family serine protease [Actinomycetota bacterium]
MESEDGIDGDGPLFPWLPPDDRLWRHPSELATNPTGPGPTVAVHESDRRLWAVALLAGVVGALLASGVGVVAGSFHHSTTVVQPFERIVDPSTPQVTLAFNPSDPTSTNDSGNPIVGIAARLRPSIVELLVNGDGTGGTGSGVIFRSDGYVLTNSHVIDGASSIVAVLSDGHRVQCAMVGSDPVTDIAVVKLETDVTRSVATLGSSIRLKVGELAVAIGSPLGLAGGPTVTRGIISALGRQVSSGGGPALIDMIQTDASIAPGSSGGALVDANGMVVGITSAIAVGDQGPQGMGFATPIEVARGVADQLLTTGKVTHVWLGVDGADVDSLTALQLGISGGAVVQNVQANSPASKAGLVASDVITGLGGQTIMSMDALEVALQDRRPGDHVTLFVMRDGRRVQVDTMLAERPVNLTH